MYDASDFVLELFWVKGWIDVSRAPTDAQENYSTTKKGLLAVIFTLDKFHL